ncbi:MAG: class I SAM-dependent methyltransferase [Actinomycetota bacterium]|nr:class I SAM-dependent methyltransferase [Actinomycetota bacterium]
MRPVTPWGILAAHLDHLDELLDQAQDLDPVALTVLHEARSLAGGLDDYLEQYTTPESPALARLALLTRSADWGGSSTTSTGHGLEAEMLSGHVEGQVLKFLVHATRARRVLEVGMFTGYSALAMAETLPPDGEVVACEIDSGVAQFAERCFADSAEGRKVEVRVGPALETLALLAGERQVFDLVFIDADKPGYLGYLDAVLEGDLLAPHGLVCVDNTLMQGQPWASPSPTVNGLAIRDFNRSVAADHRVEQVILPVRDGLTLIRRAPGAVDLPARPPGGIPR